MRSVFAKSLPFVLSVALMLSAINSLYTPPVQAATVPTPHSVSFYGDSITYGAQDSIGAQMAARKGWTYEITSYPGAAVCDWQADLKADLVNNHPSIVVLETMGNNYTPCMKNGNGVLPTFGTQAWLNKYSADLNAFFRAATAAKAKVLFVNPLPEYYPTNNAGLAKLMKVAIVTAKKYPGVSITSAPRHAVSNNGTFTWTKPCLPSETAVMGCKANTKTIIVRAPDGIHLCPTGNPPVPQLCPVYSSGQARFAQAIVNAAFNLPKPLRP